MPFTLTQTSDTMINLKMHTDKELITLFNRLVDRKCFCDALDVKKEAERRGIEKELSTNE